jgi:hypothetical protein
MSSRLTTSGSRTTYALLEAEADRLCNAQRYERSEARRDTRAGHYERQLQTKAGEVRLKVPKLRGQTFETAIIEHYRRRDSSVGEALIEMYLAGVSVRRVEDITGGNISTSNGAMITVATTTGSSGAILLATTRARRRPKDTVDLSNNVTFSGNGSANSYPMILSTNSENAISLSNRRHSLCGQRIHRCAQQRRSQSDNGLQAPFEQQRNRDVI